MSKIQKRPNLKNVKITGAFWRQKQDLIKDVVVPFQEDILNDRVKDAPPSHAIENFRIAAGEAEGHFFGLPFQDTDVAKWLETAAYILNDHADPELEARTDEVIRLIGKAQQEDGYLDTYYILENKERWTNLREHHELYTAGHMIEAAVAYYNATGKDEFLKIMQKNADLIDKTFGKGKTRGYPGHPEIEIALMSLYRATGEERYMNLAEYFINERGTSPELFQTEIDEWGPVDPNELYFTDVVSQRTLAHIRWDETGGNVYVQAHAPVREQKRAAGHAVRALYLYTAMADLASENGDETLFDACKVLWDNIISKQMYITGGLGSTATGEAFGPDYELPNDTVYAETCASVAMVFFASRMLELDVNGKYTDVIEREIYNGTLSGMQLNGKGFFYVNPLEVIPGVSGEFPGHHHVVPERFKWHICACCPPNLARMIASLGQYAYGESSDTAYVHLYTEGTAELSVNGGVTLKCDTEYPLDGRIKITAEPKKQQSSFTVALHIPEWSKDYSVKVNGEEITAELKNGYLYINRRWSWGDEITLDLPFMPVRMYANSHVRSDAGCVALQYGPTVYCLESKDNGENLSEIVLPRNAEIKAERKTDPVLGEYTELKAQGYRMKTGASLYSNEAPIPIPAEITAIPYHTWANRGKDEMRVWIHEIY